MSAPTYGATRCSVYTNNPMCGAFRGFGVPQAAVCHEGQMNALAKALNMDPIELRLAQRPQGGHGNPHRPDADRERGLYRHAAEGPGEGAGSHAGSHGPAENGIREGLT